MRLVAVRLVGMPLALHARTAQHSDEVRREFAHLADDPDSSHAPARLIALDRSVQDRFSGFTEVASAELDAAVERGDDTFDATFVVPDEVGSAARELGALWDEVDQYCEEGQYLLTLESDTETIAYRRWVLGEFERQAAGLEPLSWREFSAEAERRAESPRRTTEA